MEKKMILSELIAKVISEMERLRYSQWTIKVFKSKCRELSQFVTDTNRENIFTEQLGSEYLKHKYDYPPQENIVPLREMPGRTISAVRCIKRLGEYNLHGALISTSRSNFDLDWGKDDLSIIEVFLKAAKTADNNDNTIRKKIYSIKRFYDFLSFRDIHKISVISAQMISDYVCSLHGGSPVSAKHLLSTLKQYLHFLSSNGYMKYDLSHAVPSIKRPQNAKIPALWSTEDLERLLKSVDRGNSTGKRNYAIMLLVIQLGIRVSDIANLKLDNLKWERKSIEFSQHKTGKYVVYPMFDDVGWALIDYIRYARPKSNSPFVFLICKAPYTNFLNSTANGIMQRYMRQSGIPTKPGVASGMHSLRHALARRLLEHGTSLPTVANIMGHTSYLSTSPYLKVDIEGLRECAISLEGVAVL
jgi:site-specific recombinase XerD